MPFTFTKSYRTYLKDPAARSAVDYILGSKKPEVPADLEWDRLRDFHAAVLAAHQVRCEYAIALHDRWNKVWEPALKDCGFADSLEPLLYNESQEYDSYPSDTYSLWGEPVLDRVYASNGRKLGLGVWDATEQAYLTLWLLNGQGEDLTARLEQNLAQDDGWTRKDGYLYSREGLAPIKDGEIALDPLNCAAKRALRDVGRNLGLAERR